MWPNARDSTGSRLRVRVTLGVLALLLFFGFRWSPPGRDLFRRLQHPYVVLVTLDTLNLRYLRPYRRDFRLTPNLERFAAAGTRFEHAYTQVPITLPSHTTILSGVSPVKSRVMTNGDTVPDSLVTLPEIFRAHGYTTAAFVSLGVLNHSFHLNQGFDTYDDELRTPYHRWYRTADEVVRAVKGWVINHVSEPFFLWVHFSDPHEPYQAKDAPPDTELYLGKRLIGRYHLTAKMMYDIPLRLQPGTQTLRWRSIRRPRSDDGPRTALVVQLQEPDLLRRWIPKDAPAPPGEFPLQSERIIQLVNPSDHEVTIRLRFTGYLRSPPLSEIREGYAAEVRFMDRQFGELLRLFEHLQVDRRTFWIVLSDHGEGLYYHPGLGHATFVYEDQLRIAWMMKGPGVPRGETRKVPVLSLDVAPTVLEALDLPREPSMEGRSRWSCLRRPSTCRGWNEWWAYGAEPRQQTLAGAAVYLWPYKSTWMVRPGFALYAVLEDPDETRPLPFHPGAAPHDRRAALFLRLRRELSRRRNALDVAYRHRRQRVWSKEQEDLLRSLGYIGTSAPPQPSKTRHE